MTSTNAPALRWEATRMLDRRPRVPTNAYRYRCWYDKSRRQWVAEHVDGPTVTTGRTAGQAERRLREAMRGDHAES